jgi:hypothetical protein
VSGASGNNPVCMQGACSFMQGQPSLFARRTFCNLFPGDVTLAATEAAEQNGPLVRFAVSNRGYPRHPRSYLHDDTPSTPTLLPPELEVMLSAQIGLWYIIKRQTQWCRRCCGNCSCPRSNYRTDSIPDKVDNNRQAAAKVVALAPHRLLASLAFIAEAGNRADHLWARLSVCRRGHAGRGRGPL